MKIQTLHRSVDNVADGQAKVGHGRFLHRASDQATLDYVRLACRDNYNKPSNEQQLLNHIVTTTKLAGYTFARSLIVDYYVSLKANPFVIFTGPQGRGKTELVQKFAEALVGCGNGQYAMIPCGTSWHDHTGEDNYYRSLQARFCSWRFVELLQEAADPGNVGKVYLVCFDALTPDELEYYFSTLLYVSSTGKKRLHLPGFPPEQQPVVPSNLYITATIDIDRWDAELSPKVLRHAGLIEFRAPFHEVPQTQTKIAPSPVGYQRIWLQSALRDVETARYRLSQLLGPDCLNRLRCSPELAQLLWRGGVVLTTQLLEELTTYIANSFDEDGTGLFDVQDRLANAQIAFDAQVIQRVLWRLRGSSDVELHQDLINYLDRMTMMAWQQAVA
ncbi:MAG: 5-methylcytosine-specific restriction endonuclease McrBC, GTP-binding regulatory subunit McrB [Chloroflexi bacterium AL-W]|nr:5-methylcytosine-specific restriction endonuclease McrBC, GTP-binding regulatory subunit McrB [Chloroflexi bacterium AL-N1]NOK69000.1 5-methylcytosine-specific restriction endonuclease McrBC, GTP-binding regulatory subunit McrB [Chloroflexi bacterium AL-N10]NOK76983.1 5-methylcytosine-specific restriction endonuclease McrBC, GTP-binding regulatory subunit McrB [Chloroflexi bacterium AL-N5]NOK82629.1 5-methylcytosine-specific restriction endonuclease McrBC, GTP-binding regulatory subunit McrB 